MESSTKIATATTLPLSPTTTLTSEDAHNALPRLYRWRPTFWRARPLLGVLFLLITICCLIASLVILNISDGDNADKWTFQPAVYLAIATAMSNTALQCALSQAAPISWWYKALRGSLVKDLELDWEAGQGFPRAFIKSFRYRRMVSLFSIASFATAFVLIDGPILQKSSSVQRATINDRIPLNISLAPQLPTGFSVNIVNGNWEFTPAAVTVYEAHVNKQPIISPVTCDGICKAVVRAPGYAPTGCQNQTWLITESMLRTPNSTWGIGFEGRRADAMHTQPLLTSVVYPVWEQCVNGTEPMVISTGRANYQDCQGNFTFSNCTFIPAVLEYEIAIENGMVTYEPPAIVHSSFADNYCSNYSVLAYSGFMSIMLPNTFSNGSLGHWDPAFIPPGAHPIEVADTQTFNSFSWSYVDMIAGSDECTMRTRDPMDDIIAQYNDVLFRAGLLAGSWANITELLPLSSLPVHQSVSATQIKEMNVFKSDLRWFLGAAAIQILTVVLIVPAFWGWWKIGIELTLSPFHTAKAFDAPLFRDINSAAGSIGLVKEAGDMHIQLGAVDVEKPVHGIGLYGHQQNMHRSRLGIDTPDRVARPQRDATFID